jgi:hypothetical protein
MEVIPEMCGAHMMKSTTVYIQTRKNNIAKTLKQYQMQKKTQNIYMFEWHS